MPAAESKQAVVYAAKSTADERGSIPTQLEDGRRFAEAEGLAVVAEFADEAASAYSGDRGPELAKARVEVERLAAQHGESVLIVQHSDRLARGDGVEAAHLVEYALWAIKSGVKIRSIQDPQTFADLLYAVVTGQRNHEDSKRKSLAVRAGHDRRAKRGQFHGGQRPYGYRIEDGILIVIEREAVIVRRIYSEAMAGRSILEIARGLAADKVPTLKGGKWHGATVRVILRNPIYIGRLRHNDEVCEGEHEPIIDEGTWHKAQALAGQRARTYGRGRPPAGSHLFRKGMLRCECGEAMVPRTDRNRTKTGPYEAYKCLGRMRDPESCQMPTLRREEIDGAVYRYFEQVGLDVDATRQTLAEARDRRLAEVRALRATAERESKAAQEALERVRRDYQRGAIEADDWAEQRPQLAEELQGARAEAERLRASEAQVDQGAGITDAEQETLERLTSIRRAIAGEVRDAEGTDAIRAALSRLFDGFIVHRSTPDRVHVELAGQTWIEPIVREQAVEGYSESMRPVLRREPLDQAVNNRHSALVM
jgi:site-specific DNA recombinase